MKDKGEVIPTRPHIRALTGLIRAHETYAAAGEERIALGAAQLVDPPRCLRNQLWPVWRRSLLLDPPYGKFHLICKDEWSNQGPR